MIEVIAKHILQRRIVEEVQEAGFHSISAEEVTASNDEILSGCLRFVDQKCDIREEFLEFIGLDRITGVEIGSTLTKFYENAGIEIKECRGQCYDGVPNMQSEKKRAAKVILEKSPNAAATHCCSHNLNFCLSASCKLEEIDNVLEQYKSITIFFNSSPKREKLLEFVVSTQGNINAERRKVLIGMCKTRWSGRDIAYEHFYLAPSFHCTSFRGNFFYAFFCPGTMTTHAESINSDLQRGLDRRLRHTQQ